MTREEEEQKSVTRNWRVPVPVGGIVCRVEAVKKED